MAKRSFVTMKDVAKIAHVSVSTVSHVVNGTRFVKPSTRQKILKAIASLQYHPNLIAQSLKKRSTRTIGLILPDLTNPIFAEIMRGIEKRLSQENFSTIITNTDYDVEKEKKAALLLSGKRVDGFIILPATDEDRHIQSIIEQEIPVVLIDHEMEKLQTDTVLLNQKRGSCLLTKHLISLGHERIGLIAGRLNCWSGKQRLSGYLKGLEQSGLVKDDELIKVGDFREPSGYSLTWELLSLSRRPTAIIACNNLMALGVLKALSEKGVQIPNEMGLAVFGDLPWFKYVRPSLTVVAAPTADFGEIMGKLILERLKGNREKPRRVVFEMQLIPRDSGGEEKSHLHLG